MLETVVPEASIEDDEAKRGRLLRDWLAHPEILQLPQITIPHVAVEGRVTLLSGREKIGKSTFAAGVVSAASRGDDVLGVPIPRPVHTLWYALDEHISDAVRRFDNLGADINKIVINDWPRSASELTETLENDLAKFIGIDHVAVDNWSRVLAMSGIDPNSSREVEPVLANLVDFFHRENISATLLYHTGKAGREYRGSTAIGATVDEILTLRKRGQAEEDDFDDDSSDDGRRLLVQEGRTLRGRVHLTCVDGVYRLYEDSNPPRTRIIDALRDHGTVGSRGELAKLAGVRKAAGLHAIAELIVEGAIVESGRNLKLSATQTRFPASSISPPREPPPAPSGFPGSARFPEGGSTPEPHRELWPTELGMAGSRFGNPIPTGTGTARLTRIQDGRHQELVPTAHGDKWLDIEAA